MNSHDGVGFNIHNLISIIIVYRNRIALLQKEEERSRKKIDQTKEKAEEMLALRQAHEKKLKEISSLNNEANQWQLNQKRKNLKFEIESRRHKIETAGRIHNEKMGDVLEMKLEKTILNKILIHDQQRELDMKRRKHEIVKKMEEEARNKRMEVKLQHERNIKSYLSMKAKQEEDQARKAEQLVHMLAEKEKAWIAKLQYAQKRQERMVKEMEDAILQDTGLNNKSPRDSVKSQCQRPPKVSNTKLKS